MNDCMEMPTPCQHCGAVFDLYDGCGSEKWYPDIIICVDCYLKECSEIEKDEEIKELKTQISDAEIDIKNWKEQLNELQAP